MPAKPPEKTYAELEPKARAIVDAAINLLMEYAKLRGHADGLALLKLYTPEQNREAIIQEFDEGEIRLEVHGEYLAWFCYLPEEDAYRPVGAALRIKDCPQRN